MEKDYEKPFFQVQKEITDVILNSGTGQDEYYVDDPYDQLG